MCGVLLASQSAAINAVNLRCEYRVNPLGIDVPQPRLGWTLQSGSRGDAQAAYRILVASSTSLLAADTGDLWDSGQIFSGSQNQIHYSGVTLTNHQQVFWKIRAWDAATNASAWSTNATWTMGVLATNAWLGQWISLGNADAGATWLRRNFTVGANLKRALVNVSGLGQCELSLNGAKVGGDFLSPGWTKYDKTVLYDTFDVTAQLSAGANAVGILLGNGMYNVPNTSRYEKFSGTFGPRKVIAQLRLEYADGSVTNVFTDASWKAATNGPITFNTIYGGEDYDARLEFTGWDTAGFNDAAWSNAIVVSGPGGSLRGTAYAAPPLRTREIFSVSNSYSLGTGNTLCDFGQNAAMIPTISVSGPAGTTVRVYPAELTNSSGNISQIVSPCYFTYTLKGSGTETFTPRFSYTGYRYVRVERRNSSGGTTGTLPTLNSISSAAITSASDQAGNFSCSKDLFNRIRTLIIWAQRNNEVSLISDCPQREKLGWLEQYYLHGPSLRYERDLAALYAKGAMDMADSQLGSGLVPDIAPEYTVFSGGFRDSPEWGSAFVLVPWQQLEFYGDTESFARYFSAMKNYVNYLTSQSSGYIVNYGLGDWFDLGPGTLGQAQLTPVALTATATYYMDTLALAQAATMLGNSADAATYSALATNIASAFNAQFYNATSGSYSTGSQTANAMPLALGMVDATNRARVQAALVADVRSRGNSLTAGDIGHRYLLRALADAGRSDVIYDLHTKTNTPGYGYILNLGATSLSEGWDGSASQDHFMLGHIMEWFYHDLAGIQSDPVAPGFQKIIIKPCIVGDVTWTAAGYNSVRGMVSNYWSIAGNQITMNVTIPPGSMATICLPTLGSALTNMSVTESGATIWQNGGATGGSSGVNFLRVESGSPLQSYLVWGVGSGSYQFQWTVAPAPSGLSATAIGTQVNLQWNAATGVTSYKVKRATVSGGPYAPLASGVTATNFSDATVTNNVTYYYVVSAASALGESGNSYEASAMPGTFYNFGFETPTVATYQYGITSASWTFSPAVGGPSGSGIAANGSAFTVGNPSAPEGAQVAFIQGTASVMQLIGGFIPGTTYRLTFSAAQRNNIYGGQVGQTWNVLIDGAVIASFAPPQSATNYADYTALFTATNTIHTLAFTGSNSNGGDNTVFIDNVRLAPNLPRAIYAFENNANDTSGNNNHGTASGVTYVAGKIAAKAAQFDGVSAYVGVPRSVATNFTVSLWVKTTDTGGAGAQWWSGKGLVDGEVSGASADWGTAVVNGKFAFGIGNPDTTLVSSNSINDGNWHHVAATRDSASGAMRVYVDGALQGSATGPTGPRTSPPGFRIGSIQTGSAAGFLNGAIDEVHLFDWVLSASEISALTNPPTSPTGLNGSAGDGRVNLNWFAVTNASGYNVSHAAVSDGIFTGVAASLTTTNFSDTTVSNGVLYAFAVTAQNSAGESAPALVNVRPTSAVPPQLSLAVGGGQLQIGWPADHTGWRLQSQTNAPSAGLGTNWATLAATLDTNQFFFAIGREGSVFFRLVFP